MLLRLLAVLAAAALSVALPTAHAQTSCAINVQNDIAVLNWALTLENLDSAFFSQVVSRFNVTAFQSAGYTQGDYNYFQLILAHEQAHASILQDAIRRLGGTPVPPCSYSFPITDVASAVGLAQTLENVGVTAYDGGVNGLTNPDLQVAAASIATVEARHAGYLNILRGTSAFPNATDMPRTAAEVAVLAQPFITSCSYAWNDTSRLPAIRPNGASFITAPAPPNATAQLPRGTYTAEQASNDLLTLQYALTLEQLEAAFYAQGLASGSLSEQAFIDANRTGQRTQLLLIRDHEAAHATALANTIVSRGGTPRSACTYNFTAAFSDVTSFLQTGAILEQVGVSAYDFAIQFLADTGLQTVAATIATVEARHSAYLYAVTGMQPFTNSTDQALSPTAVLQLAAPFIVGDCGGQGFPTAPVVAPSALTSCPSPRNGRPTSPSCALSNLAFNGVTLSPSFSSGTDAAAYTCSLTSSNSTSVSVTPTGAQSAARVTVTPLAASGQSFTLASGAQSPQFALGSLNSTTRGVRLDVSVPSVLFALGDSITFGETDLVYVPLNGTTRGYPRLVADYIDSVNGAAPRPDLYNFGIDGETAVSFLSGSGRLPPVVGRTDAILAQQNTNYQANASMPQATMLANAVQRVQSAGQVVQAAFITLGFNDLARIATQANATAVAMQRLSDYRSEYRTVLRRVRELLPLADLYMIGYPNPFPADPANPALQLFGMYGGMLNAIVAQLSLEFDGLFVEAFRPYLGREAALTFLSSQPAGATIPGNFSGVAPIGNVHPNDAGYRVIADQVIARMAQNGTIAGGCSVSYTFCSGASPSSSSTGTSTNSSTGGSASSSSGASGSNVNAAATASSVLALAVAFAAAVLQLKQ